MKKTYALKVEGKNPDRLLDASKHDIRKYVKRERAKALPDGADFLDFDCKVGASQEVASVVHFGEIMVAVNALASGGAEQFYIEIESKPGYRAMRPTNTLNVENTPHAL